MTNPVLRWWAEDVPPNEKPGLKMLAMIFAGVMMLAVIAKLSLFFL